MENLKTLCSSRHEDCIISRLNIDVREVMDLPSRYLLLPYWISKHFTGKVITEQKIYDEFGRLGDFVYAGFEKIEDKLSYNMNRPEALEALQILQEKLAKFGLKIKYSEFDSEDVRINCLQLTDGAKKLLSATNQNFKSLGNIYEYGAEKLLKKSKYIDDGKSYVELVSAMMQYGIKPANADLLERSKKTPVLENYFSELVRTVHLHYFDKYADVVEKEVTVENTAIENKPNKTKVKTVKKMPEVKKEKIEDTASKDVITKISQPVKTEITPSHIIPPTRVLNVEPKTSNEVVDRKRKLSFEFDPEFKNLSKEDKDNYLISELKILGEIDEIIRIKNCFKELGIYTIGDLARTSKSMLASKGFTSYYYEKISLDLKREDYIIDSNNIYTNKDKVYLSGNCRGKSREQLLEMSIDEIIFVCKEKDKYRMVFADNGIDTIGKLISYSRQNLVDAGITNYGIKLIENALIKYNLKFTSKVGRPKKEGTIKENPYGISDIITEAKYNEACKLAAEKYAEEREELLKKSNIISMKQLNILKYMVGEEFSKLSTQVLNLFGISPMAQDMLDMLRYKGGIKTINDLINFGMYKLRNIEINKKKLKREDICMIQDILAYYSLKFFDNRSKIKDGVVIRTGTYKYKPFNVTKRFMEIAGDIARKPRAKVLYPDLIPVPDSSYVNTSLGDGTVRVKKADINAIETAMENTQEKTSIEQKQNIPNGESAKTSENPNDEKFYFNNNGYINKSIMGRVCRHNFGKKSLFDDTNEFGL